MIHTSILSLSSRSSQFIEFSRRGRLIKLSLFSQSEPKNPSTRYKFYCNTRKLAVDASPRLRHAPKQFILLPSFHNIFSLLKRKRRNSILVTSKIETIRQSQSRDLTIKLVDQTKTTICWAKFRQTVFSEIDTFVVSIYYK
jgi:hypothetical protein